MKIRYLLLTLFTTIIPFSLNAFEGRIHNISGKTAEIIGNQVSKLKPGHILFIYDGKKEKAKLSVVAVFHTKAKAKILSGDTEVGNAVSDRKQRKKEEEKKNSDGFYSTKESDYKDNGDGTVTDMKNKLIWMKCSFGQKNFTSCSGDADRLNWKKAGKTCQNFKLAGKKWRLPSLSELKTLRNCTNGFNSRVNICESNSDRPTIFTNKFPNTPENFFWSTTIFEDKGDNAWGLMFDDGLVFYFKQNVKFHTRCIVE